MTKQCSKCNKTKPTTEFHIRKARKSGFNSWCKLCIKKWKSKPNIKRHNKMVYKLWIANNKDIKRETIKRGKWKVKFETIDAYGGKCSCCDEDAVEFLTIDHILGDGAVERKIYGKGSNFYRHLRRNGYPKDKYRLLCWNCNSASGVYGYCPHNLDGKARRIRESKSIRSSINRPRQENNKRTKVQPHRSV